MTLPAGPVEPIRPGEPLGVPDGVPIEVPVLRLDPGLDLPSYARPGDAGADLRTAVDVRLAPGERAVVPTGIALALPPGHAAFVHPRSGLAARFGVALVNAPGTIDSGYRGEIQVILINLDPRAQLVLARGDRIAQLVIQRVETARFVEVAALPDSERGAAGLGSTGGLRGAAGPGAPADENRPAQPGTAAAHPDGAGAACSQRTFPVPEAAPQEGNH